MFSSTIIACSNSVIAVVFSNTRTMSVSLHTSFRMSVSIVTTIEAFWCVSRRCADKKLFIIFSKMNWSVAGLQWRAHVMNGFEIAFCTVIWNFKKEKLFSIPLLILSLNQPFGIVESIWQPNPLELFAAARLIDSQASRCRPQLNSTLYARLELIQASVPFPSTMAMAKCNDSLSQRRNMSALTGIKEFYTQFLFVLYR